MIAKMPIVIPRSDKNVLSLFDRSELPANEKLSNINRAKSITCFTVKINGIHPALKHSLKNNFIVRKHAPEKSLSLICIPAQHSPGREKVKIQICHIYFRMLQHREKHSKADKEIIKSRPGRIKKTRRFYYLCASILKGYK